MLALLINTAAPEQDGILDKFDSPGKGSTQEFVRGDKVLSFTHRPVLPSISNVRPWDDDHLSTDTYEVAIGRRDAIPLNGLWPLTIGAQTASDLSCNISASDLQTALSAKSVLAGFSAVIVSLLSDGVYQADWTTNGVVPQMTSGDNTLSPISTVATLVIRAGSAGSKARQIIILRQSPVAYSQPATELPAASVVAANTVAGDGAHNKRYTITLTPGTYGGSFSLIVTAITGAAQSLGLVSGTISADDFATKLATQTVIASVDNVSVSRINDVITVEFIGTQGFSNTPVIDVSNVDLVAPKGVSGTIALNTDNLYYAFFETEQDELTFTLSIRRTRVTGEEREYYLADVTLKRNLLDVLALVPLTLTEYYSQTQVDAIIAGLFAYSTAALSTAGDTEITLADKCKQYTFLAAIGAGAGAYTRNIDLGVTNRVTGDKACVILSMPDSVNPTINVRDNTTPTIIWTELGSGVAYIRPLWFTWNGAAWLSDQ